MSYCRYALILIILLASLGFPTGSRTLAADSYYFTPFVNPYQATVFELPPAFQAVLPETVPEYVFKLIPHPERIIPEVFWYSDGLTCSLIAQNHRAPLVEVVPIFRTGWRRG